MSKKTVYKDIDLSFKRHPITGDLMIKTDANAVKQSISNLIRTNFYERLDPTIGCNLKSILFKNNNVASVYIAKKELKSMIEQFEPRAKVMDVTLSSTDTEYRINLIILINTINTTDAVDVILQKVS